MDCSGLPSWICQICRVAPTTRAGWPDFALLSCEPKGETLPSPDDTLRARQAAFSTRCVTCTYPVPRNGFTNWKCFCFCLLQPVGPGRREGAGRWASWDNDKRGQYYQYDACWVATLGVCPMADTKYAKFRPKLCRSADEVLPLAGIQTPAGTGSRVGICKAAQPRS